LTYYIPPGLIGLIGLKIGKNNPWQTKGWGYTTTEDSEELENLYANFAGRLKVDPKWIAKANRFEWTGPKLEPMVATSQQVSQEYQYTLERPRENWTKPSFNAQDWQSGKGGSRRMRTRGLWVEALGRGFG